MNNSLPNFERLVLGFVKADFCNQILILQHFSRSTRSAILCTAPNSKLQQKIVHNFYRLKIELNWILQFVWLIFAILRGNCNENLSEFRKKFEKMKRMSDICRFFCQILWNFLKIVETEEKIQYSVHDFNSVLRQGSTVRQRVTGAGGPMRRHQATAEKPGETSRCG